MNPSYNILTNLLPTMMRVGGPRPIDPRDVVFETSVHLLPRKFVYDNREDFEVIVDRNEAPGWGDELTNLLWEKANVAREELRMAEDIVCDEEDVKSVLAKNLECDFAKAKLRLCEKYLEGLEEVMSDPEGVLNGRA